MRTLGQLVNEYCQIFLPLALEQERVVVQDRLEELLSAGWADETIMLKLLDHVRAHGTEPNLARLFRGQPHPVNLLDPFAPRIHSQLWVTSPRPRITVDYNQGTIRRSVVAFVREPRCSYTVDDLYSYYYTVLFCTEKHPAEIRRIRGGLTWMANAYRLDLTLFTIDVLGGLIRKGEVKLPSSPVVLTNYLKEAAELQAACANELAKEKYEPVDFSMDRGRREAFCVQPQPHDDGGPGGGFSEAV